MRATPLALGLSFLFSLCMCAQECRPMLKEQPVSASGVTSEGESSLEFDGTFRRLREREKVASEMVVRMDRGLMLSQEPRTEKVSKTWKLESQKSMEKELLETDQGINEDLQRAYKIAASDKSAQANEKNVQIALLHWMVLLRRNTMQGFHTEVAGLEDDPDCAGDVIGDQLLERYFEALFEKDATSRGAAVLALIDLARQTACLGEQQSGRLAARLYRSYMELEGFLRLNGLDEVTPYVAQAAAEPLLLFYDVEKYRGPNSPLMHWFADHREALLQGARTKRNPALWHGLWLYDRRSGRLRGYRVTSRPQNENDVNLELFLGSLSRPENMGFADCSFSEMIGRGATQAGYFCAGSSCGRPANGNGPPGNQTMSSFLKDPLGENLQATICDQTGTSGKDGGGGGGRFCDQGLNLGAGENTAAATVNCVSQQVVQPGTEGMKCIAEVTGLCSNPLDKIAKDMQQTQFSGVKLGKDCQLQQASGASPDQKYKDAELQAYREMIREQADAARNLDKQIDAIEKDYKTKKDNENDLHGDKLNGCKNDPVCTKGVDTDHKEDIDKIQKDHDQALKAARDAEAKEKQKAKEKYDEKVKKAAEEKKKDQSKQDRACNPDMPDCGDNSCTAMSRETQQMLQCAQSAIDPKQDPFQTKKGGCNPDVCDPADPTETKNSGFSKCLSSIGDDPSTATARQCWAVHCASGEIAFVGGGGACGCQGAGPDAINVPAGGLNNFCAMAHCTEDAARAAPAGIEGGGDTGPGTGGGVGGGNTEGGQGVGTWINGSCSCGQSIGGTGGTLSVPPQPRGGFNVSSPTLFSDVNGRGGTNGFEPGTPPR